MNDLKVSSKSLQRFLGVKMPRIAQLSRAGILKPCGAKTYFFFESLTNYFKYLRGQTKRYSSAYAYEVRRAKRRIELEKCPWYQDLTAEVGPVPEVAINDLKKIIGKEKVYEEKKQN